MDLANKPLDEIRRDFHRIAREYGPCDMVIADIDASTPDERIAAAVGICNQLSERAANAPHNPK